MSKVEKYDDSVDDIDPIMEQAFSVDDSDDDTVSERLSSGETGPVVSKVQFPNISRVESKNNSPDADLFNNITVDVSVELGRSQVSLKEVYELTEGSIIELERLVGEPLDLVVNGQVIAQGEVVAIDSNYGLRVTNILSQAKE